MNSCRKGVQAWPTAVRKAMPASHSSGRQLHLAREVVQVAHGRLHHAQARVRGGGHLGQHLAGHAEAIEILHPVSLPGSGPRQAVAVCNTMPGRARRGQSSFSRAPRPPGRGGDPGPGEARGKLAGSGP
jgi:hypothetical protein